MSDRLLIGKFAENDYRLRIVAPGCSARDQTLSDDKVYFDSTWPQIPKVAYRGQLASPTSSGSTATYAWPDMGFVPANIISVGPQWTRPNGHWIYVTRGGLHIPYNRDPEDISETWRFTAFFTIFDFPQGGVIG